ncbi:hypothetical protein [Kosmotoga pacifica]|uniref:Uncharacterized protein n=1 Tax=Kosmotoga pacifica TaxID=1330330 RepID=A0A0G2ZAL8_9BACT|nr:hypothetical protein [Kosmotoga pacifica]AKI96624.1 hypothetical protein IX53_00955 [Kosmotoga pacifica]
MIEQKILDHYSKGSYIETYFKEAKQMKVQVFLTRNTERHVELVHLTFTIWMLARFYRSFKDQIWLKNFLEELRFNYYLWVTKK